MGFPDAMKRILDGRGIKQADLCRMTKIQTSLMSEYMTGKKGPTLTNAIKIADALSLTLDELADMPLSNSSAEDEFDKLIKALRERPQFRKNVEQMLLLDDESQRVFSAFLSALQETHQ